MNDAVIRMGKRAAFDPHFFAHKIGTAFVLVAERLGCTVKQVAHIALCQKPTCEADVDRIAGKFGANPDVLMGIWLGREQ